MSINIILGEKTTLPEYKNIAGVMIGTGLGFALMKDDRVLLNEKHGPYVSIFNTPYNGGVAEDFVSGRGIVSKYNAVSGKAVKTAKDVACLAEQGDENAIFTYRQMGTVLAETIKPVLAKQKTEALIIGGQIARSLHLFEDVLESQLGDLSELKIIRASRLIDTGHLLGAAKLAYSN